MSGHIWTSVGGLAAAAFAAKAVGPVFFGGRELPALLARVMRLLAPALIAGLVAVDTFSAGGRTLAIDARSAGLAIAAAALALRANILIVVLAAAAVTALVRALG